MAKFTDLSEQDRIQYIKDGFILILESLTKDPSKLKNYIELEEPKLSSPMLEDVNDVNVGETEINARKERNRLIQEAVSAANDELLNKYKTKVNTFKKIEAIISGMKKKEACICGSCININITNSIIPHELEALIDIARKEAEERSY
jgi:hypothetical protein